MPVLDVYFTFFRLDVFFASHGCIIDSINNILDASLPGVLILFSFLQLKFRLP